jgi:hypothetical protein
LVRDRCYRVIRGNTRDGEGSDRPSLTLVRSRVGGRVNTMVRRSIYRVDTCILTAPVVAIAGIAHLVSRWQSGTCVLIRIVMI